MKQSVEEIVNKYWGKKMTLSLAQDLENDINQALTQAVEGERERISRILLSDPNKIVQVVGKALTNQDTL